MTAGSVRLSQGDWLSHEAGQLARSAELADIAGADERAARTLAGYRARLDEGVEGAALDEVLAAIGRIGKGRDQRAARAAELRAGLPPAPVKAEDHDGVKALLLNAGGDIGERSELVRRFVERVVISPPGQGSRMYFNPASIQVIPGAWAHGMENLDLPVPDGTHTGRYQDVVTAYVTAHPGASSREVADGTGRSHSFAATVLRRLLDAGDVTGVKEGRGMRYSLP